jgi:hypothetical protein
LRLFLCIWWFYNLFIKHNLGQADPKLHPDNDFTLDRILNCTGFL